MLKTYILTIVTFIAVIPATAHAWGDRAKESKWANTLIKTDIAYGNDDLQKLDIYAPRGQKALKPVLIFVHGGGWQRGDKKMAKDHGKFYADQGIILVSVNYRLAPKDLHPAQAIDTAAAVKWVYDHISDYGGDKNNIYISGHSAGAHLVGLIGTDNKYLATHNLSPTMFKAVFPNDTGSFDFNDPIEKGARIVQPKIDETFGTDPVGLAEASPITYARSNKSFPHFVMFVTAERPDAVRQTKAFDDALKGSGAQSEMHVIDGNSHREMNLAMSDPNSPISKKILEVIWGQ